jgi:hypothetical protein
MLNFLTSWHRKCSASSYGFAVFDFFLSGCIKPISSCSDEEEPKRDAAAAPSTQDVIADEPPVQETEPVMAR